MEWGTLVLCDFLFVGLQFETAPPLGGHALIGVNSLKLQPFLSKKIRLAVKVIQVTLIAIPLTRFQASPSARFLPLPPFSNGGFLMGDVATIPLFFG